MEKLTGHSPKQLQRELDSLVYRNPEGEGETADRYLSGDVRAKLNTPFIGAGGFFAWCSWLLQFLWWSLGAEALGIKRDDRPAGRSKFSADLRRWIPGVVPR